MENINEFQTSLLNNEASLRVWRAFIQADARNLGDLDDTRLNLMVLTTFRNYENAYFARVYGQMGEKEWERFERNICRNFDNARAASRQSLLADVLTEEFMQYIVEFCSE